MALSPADCCDHEGRCWSEKRWFGIGSTDMRGIFSVGPPETKCGSGVVDWDPPPRFRSFRAFLCTSRLVATRKADQLCKHSGSFIKASASRAHLSWRFRGVIKRARDEQRGVVCRSEAYPAVVPRWFRTACAVDLHFFRSGSAILPQWFFTSSAVVLYFFRSGSAVVRFSSSKQLGVGGNWLRQG